MKIYAGEIYAFASGAALSWIITYLRLTQNGRTIKEIKSNLELLAAYHDLSKEQYRQTMLPTKLATDEEILAIYNHVVRLRADKLSGRHYKKVSLKLLAAEIIICVRLLDLTEIHAIRAMLRSSSLSDLQQSLREITAEIVDQHSN